MKRLDIGLSDGSDAGVHDIELDFVIGETGQFLTEGIDGALDVGSDDDVEFGYLALCDRREDGFQVGGFGYSGETFLVAAGFDFLGDFLGAAGAAEHVESIAGLGNVVQAGHLDGCGWSGFLEDSAILIL